MFIKSIYNIFKREWYKFQVNHFPKKILSEKFRNKLGYDIDWEHPRDINEKIQWLQVYSDTSEWTRLADKYLVRDFIKERGCENLLVNLLGVYHSSSEINYDSLPKKFVLKCNHDSGSVHVIDKSKGFDKEKINADLDRHVKIKFGYVHAEAHYNKIKPLILAEEYLEENDHSFSFSLIDYKVWCFNGKPYCIWTCYNRDKNGTDVNLFDLNWNVRPEASVFTSHYRDGRGKVPRPSQLEEMLQAAAKLSEGFPEVRVDFYIVNNKVYFGEMTFSSAMGRMNFYTKEFLNELGDQVDLSLAKLK